MWIDERGSEVLALGECRRLLTLGAHQGRHGHLGLVESDMPVVLPVDYVMDESDVVLRVGEGLFDRLVGRLVAFQVDGLSATGLVAVERCRVHVAGGTDRP